VRRTVALPRGTNADGGSVEPHDARLTPAVDVPVLPEWRASFLRDDANDEVDEPKPTFGDGFGGGEGRGRRR